MTSNTGDHSPAELTDDQLDQLLSATSAELLDHVTATANPLTTLIAITGITEADIGPHLRSRHADSLETRTTRLRGRVKVPTAGSRPQPLTPDEQPSRDGDPDGPPLDHGPGQIGGQQAGREPAGPPAPPSTGQERGGRSRA
jgi:hypothetical protein